MDFLVSRPRDGPSPFSFLRGTRELELLAAVVFILVFPRQKFFWFTYRVASGDVHFWRVGRLLSFAIGPPELESLMPFGFPPPSLLHLQAPFPPPSLGAPPRSKASNPSGSVPPLFPPPQAILRNRPLPLLHFLCCTGFLCVRKLLL